MHRDKPHGPCLDVVLDYHHVIILVKQHATTMCRYGHRWTVPPMMVRPAVSVSSRRIHPSCIARTAPSWSCCMVRAQHRGWYAPPMHPAVWCWCMMISIRSVRGIRAGAHVHVCVPEPVGGLLLHPSIATNQRCLRLSHHGHRTGASRVEPQRRRHVSKLQGDVWSPARG